MNNFDLLRPRDFASALTALSRGATAKAGGIDLLDRMKEGIDRPERLLDLRPLAELRGIEKATLDGRPAIKIGALATLAEVAASPLVREHARALLEAASDAATPQVRNRATVGGNLFQRTRCWYARNAEFEPCLMRGGTGCPAKEGRNKVHAIFDTDGPCVAVDPSNLAPALVALGASFVMQGATKDGGRVETVTGVVNLAVPGRNALPGDGFPQKGEGLLTHVYVPIVPDRRSAYIEFAERESFDWALASCAVSFRLEGGVARDPIIVLGAVALRVRECEAAEAVLEGKKVTPEVARLVAEKALEGARPLAENGFKVPVARALVARAILAAVEEKK